jgi:hypothetical protein
MTEEGRSDDNEASLRMANEFVEVANNKLATGVHPMVIASAIRHAAANFTAFAYAHGTDDSLDTASIAEEFLRLLENYDKRQRGEARSVTALERLVEQVKNE